MTVIFGQQIYEWQQGGDIQLPIKRVARSDHLV